MAIIQMELCIGQQNLICIAHVKENQRTIRAFLKCVTLDQIVLVDIHTVALNDRNKIPLYGTNTCSDASNQRRALNRTCHLEIRKPLPNQSLHGGDFDLVDHGIENEQLIV